MLIRLYYDRTAYSLSSSPYSYGLWRVFARWVFLLMELVVVVVTHFDGVKPER